MSRLNTGRNQTPQSGVLSIEPGFPPAGLAIRQQRGAMSSQSEEFDAFYHATNRRLLHQMYAMTGNLADAQECVQEAYARAWQHWKSVQQAADPAAWVRTVAWRIAASRWRKARNGVKAFARHGRPEHSQPPSPDHVALVSALRDISEEQRRAIVLHHLVGMSVEEVAREVGAPVGTIKARLSRGRAALAELLRDEPVGGDADVH
jgi:RNA polymerase sigma-70 factor (ECF subfamily)